MTLGDRIHAATFLRLLVVGRGGSAVAQKASHQGRAEQLHGMFLSSIALNYLSKHMLSAFGAEMTQLFA